MSSRKHRGAAVCAALFFACSGVRGSTVYSNLVVRMPDRGDESISGENGIIFDDVLVPNALNPTGGAIGITSVTYGIERENEASAVTLTGYATTTTTPRVGNFPQLVGPPTALGSTTLDAYSGNEMVQTAGIVPSAPVFVTPQMTDAPGFNEFAIGLQLSPMRSGNLWAVGVPNSPSANFDGAWDYDIPSNTSQAYSLSDESGPIYTTFMMSITSTLPSVWNANGDASWSPTTNWVGGTPSTISDGASFGSAITAPATVTLDVPATVNTLVFDNPNSYTIAGSSTLTICAATGSASINVLQGSHTIATPLNLSTNTTVTISPASGTLTVSGALSAAAGVTLTKEGAGTLEVRNVRMDGLTINSGSVRITNDGTAAGTSKVKSLTIAGTQDGWLGQLDLVNNSLVVDYSGASPRATIENQIKSGFNGGAWNGNGITSSAAQLDHGKALGIVEASDIFTFRGQSIAATSVLVAYTESGDANLDGVVNTLDFNLLAANFGSNSGRWFRGDFNYDGTVNALDFNVLATNFGATLSSGAFLSSVVPEPSGLVATFMPFMLFGMVGRTSRKKGTLRDFLPCN